MTEEEELTEEAKLSREETEKLREESLPPDEPSPGEPWAKTSSGHADHITDDD